MRSALSEGMTVAESMRWLRGDDATDRETWIRAWAATTERRPHDHPEFLELMRPAACVSMVALVERPSAARVLYPFYLRSLGGQAFVPASMSDAVDILSPYGYGGPLYEGPESDRAATASVFEAGFAATCEELGVLAEFVREDLRQDHLLPRPVGEHEAKQDNVVLDLTVGLEERLRRWKGNARRDAQRARDLGVRVMYDRTADTLQSFMDVYEKTMRRRHASNHFYIPRARFERMLEELRPYAGFALVHAFDDSGPLSSELLLCSADTIYSLFAGTNEEGLRRKASHLVKWANMGWGIGEGYRRYVLGGGMAPGDGLFRYKASFGPGETAPYYVRRIVRDRGVYDALVESRRLREAEAGVQWEPAEGFFPEYMA